MIFEVFLLVFTEIFKILPPLLSTYFKLNTKKTFYFQPNCHKILKMILNFLLFCLKIIKYCTARLDA